jgi:DNA polymerase I
MVTPDKDFGQLVTDKILMYKPGRAGAPPEVLGPKEICARWGLSQHRAGADILGLMGDAVDNIPAFREWGEKTAMKLVQEYGSLESVIERAGEIKGKLGEKILEHKEQGVFSKKLATIIDRCAGGHRP